MLHTSYEVGGAVLSVCVCVFVGKVCGGGEWEVWCRRGGRGFQSVVVSLP